MDSLQDTIEEFKRTRNRDAALIASADWLRTFLRQKYGADEDIIGDLVLELAERFERIVQAYLNEKRSIAFRFWLAAVARNLYLDHIRYRYKVSVQEISLHDAYARSTNRNTLSQYVEKLPVQEFVMVQLFFDLPYSLNLYEMIRSGVVFGEPVPQAKIDAFTTGVANARIDSQKIILETKLKLQRLNGRRSKMKPAAYRNRYRVYFDTLTRAGQFVNYQDLADLFGCHRYQIKRIMDRANKLLAELIPYENKSKNKTKTIMANSELAHTA